MPSTFISEGLKPCATYLARDWLFAFCLKNHPASHSVKLQLIINLTQNLS